MSNSVMNAVWLHSSARGSTRMVHIAIADAANDEGHAWSFIRTLAKKCALSQRRLQEHLVTLCELGELVMIEVHGSGKMNHYWIPFLPGELGYDPLPCQETHKCNGLHTPIADTEPENPRGFAPISTRGKPKKVRSTAPINTENLRESAPIAEKVRDSGEKVRDSGEKVRDSGEKVRDSGEKVRDSVKKSASAPDEFRADGTLTQGTIRETIREPEEPARARPSLTEKFLMAEAEQTAEAAPPPLRRAPPKPFDPFDGDRQFNIFAKAYRKQHGMGVNYSAIKRAFHEAQRHTEGVTADV